MIFLFFQGNEMKIQTIFESFEQFQLGRNSLDQLYSWIVAGLEKVCWVKVWCGCGVKSKSQICQVTIIIFWLLYVRCVLIF